MNKPFENKKLLILGATPNEIPVVKRAQELGAYVITTDYNKDYKLSPAKYYSDECWDISWSDIEELKKRCVESGVTGVIAGFSEIRVDNQIRLCKELGLPCYVNEEQLAITRDKILFKEKCRQYDVPVIKEYSSMDDVTEYPVIVKPTDRAGSIGVGIAYNRAELEKAYDIAMDKSLVKRVIIEDYITDAMEMDAHYVVLDGEISLLTTDDIIAASDNVKDNKVVQSVWMYPSKYNSEFLATADQPLRDLIKGIGVKNGTIFFSGFVNNKGQFSFFECGFRLWGEQEFDYDMKRNALFCMENEDGEIIGTITVDEDPQVEALTCWSKTLQPSAELSRLGVRTDMQNQGIARQLLQHGMEELKKQGKRSVHFLVCKTNKKALRSYEKLHFDVVGESDLFDEDWWCYEKEL